MGAELTPELARAYSRLLNTKSEALVLLSDLIAATQNREIQQVLVAYREINHGHLVHLQRHATAAVRVAADDQPTLLDAVRRECDCLLYGEPLPDQDARLLHVAGAMKAAEARLASAARDHLTAATSPTTQDLLRRIATEDGEAYSHLCALAGRATFAPA